MALGTCSSKDEPGVIINISSVNAQQPGEGQVAYCAAKAGVDMITRCGALELGESRYPCRRHRARPGGDPVDEEGLGKSGHARALHGDHPDEAGG